MVYSSLYINKPLFINLILQHQEKKQNKTMKNIIVQMTLACLVLALMIAMVSAQYDYYSSAKTPNSAVTVATDIFISLAVPAVSLVADFIY